MSIALKDSLFENAETEEDKIMIMIMMIMIKSMKIMMQTSGQNELK